MRNLQRAGGMASLLNALIAVATMVVVFGVLGPAVAADPSRVAAIVRTQPVPLLLLEFFKMLSALAALTIVFAIQQRLSRSASQQARFTTIAGVISAILLLTAGIVGAIAIALASRGGEARQTADVSMYVTLNAIVNGLGLAAVFANGVWYLLVSIVATKSGLLPRMLRYLGLPLGVACLIAFILPPIALLVLVLGLIWAVWLGVFLLREPMTNITISAIGG